MPDDLEGDDLREDHPLSPEQEARARQLTAADLGALIRDRAGNSV
jgi:hypothetical protein